MPTERGIATADATAFEATAGRGVRATIDGSTVLVGTPAFLAEAGVDTSALESVDLGTATGAWVARDGRPMGVIGLADTVKPGAAEAVERLQRGGHRGLDADRRPSRDRRGDRRAGRHRSGADRGRRAAGRQGRGGRAAPVRRRRSWRWSATASTTRRRSRRPTSASPSAPAPTWRSRPPTSPSSATTSAPCPSAVRLSRATMRTIRQNLALGLRLQRAPHPGRGRPPLPAGRPPADPRPRGRRHGALERQRRPQLTAAAGLPRRLTDPNWRPMHR